MALPAAAFVSVPSQMWRGVERIVLDCRFDSSVRPDMRASLCRQFRAEAQRLTRFPVTLATHADLGRPTPLPRAVGSHLVIHLNARLARGKDGVRSLLVSASPERPGLRTWAGPWSRPARVQVTWSAGTPTLRRPVAPLSLLLSEPRRRTTSGPPFPVRSN